MTFQRREVHCLRLCKNFPIGSLCATTYQGYITRRTFLIIFGFYTTELDKATLLQYKKENGFYHMIVLDSIILIELEAKYQISFNREMLTKGKSTWFISYFSKLLY